MSEPQERPPSSGASCCVAGDTGALSHQGHWCAAPSGGSGCHSHLSPGPASVSGLWNVCPAPCSLSGLRAKDFHFPYPSVVFPQYDGGHREQERGPQGAFSSADVPHRPLCGFSGALHPQEHCHHFGLSRDVLDSGRYSGGRCSDGRIGCYGGDELRAACLASESDTDSPASPGGPSGAPGPMPGRAGPGPQLGGISSDGGGPMPCLNISRAPFSLLNLLSCAHGCEAAPGSDCICLGKGWPWLLTAWRGSGRHWDLALGPPRAVGGVSRRETQILRLTVTSLPVAGTVSKDGIYCKAFWHRE